MYWPDQLIDQAARAELQLGIARIARAHAVVAQPGATAADRRRADLVLVVLAVEQIRVDPRTAALEQVAAGGGELVSPR